LLVLIIGLAAGIGNQKNNTSQTSSLTSFLIGTTNAKLAIRNLGVLKLNGRSTGSCANLESINTTTFDQTVIKK
jgi:hypothetical protein